MAVKDGTYSTTIKRGGFINGRTTTLKRTYKGGMLTDQSSVTRSNASIFQLVFMLLIITALLAVMTGTGQPKTFYSFLKMMEGVSAPDFTWLREGISSVIVPVLDLPSWLAWLGNFWNAIVGIFRLIVFLVEGALYIVSFAWNLLGWLFA